MAEQITTPKATDTVASWRNAMSFTQRDAAIALGCSRTALAGWEASPERTPRYIRLAMAALALGIEVGGPAPSDEEIG